LHGLRRWKTMQVLSDAQWAKFEAAIEAAEIRGARPRREDRRTIEAIIWRLDNGAKWRSIPAEFGDWPHAYLRFRRWAVRGVWDKIMAHLVEQGEPQLAFACIDGTIARARQKASGARPGTAGAKALD
jgi:transposase